MEAEPKPLLEEAEVRPKEEALEELLLPPAPAPAPEDLSTLLPGYPLMSTAKRKREKAPGGPELGPCSVDRRKSKVWNFYRKLGGAYVECTICRKQLSFHNSTTTMREHLVRKHQIKDAFFSSSSSSSSSSHLREDQAPECDLGPQESFKRSRQLPPENSFYHPLESRWEVVVELLVEMIFKDLQPLSVVKDKGFGLLLGFLEPGFQLPSPEKLREVLRGRYQVAKKELESYLRGAGEVVVLSLERWRCRRQSYVSTALNLIDGDWRRARCLLETRGVGEQGAWGAGQQLQAVLQEFGLSAEAVFCVVDGGAEDVRGGEEEEKEAAACGWRRLPCAAGVLQRCVQAGLQVEGVREALSAARGIASYFQQDAKANSSLSGKLEAIGKGEVRLAPDSAWRWASTAEMCERLLELKWAIMAVLEEGQRPAELQGLADHQWRLLQDLVPVLRTIRLAAAFLQEEQNFSISSLLPCAHGLVTTIAAQAQGAGAGVRAAVERMQQEMMQRWGLAGEEVLENPAVVASFLDPRFKELRFLSPGQRSQLHLKVKEMLLELCHPQPTDEDQRWVPCTEDKAEGGREPCGASGESSSSVYDLLLGKDPTEHMPEVQQQLENYLVEPLCRRGADPLQWWRSHQRRFPAVARLSRRFLAPPSTAAPPPSAFGTADDLLERRRAALEQENLHQVLFLHHNFELLERLRSSSKGGSRNLC